MLALIRVVAVACAVLMGAHAADAQNAVPTDNRSGLIATGNTYQLIQGANESRRSLTIENNNTNGDNCWVNVDASVTAGNTDLGHHDRQ